MYTHKQTQFITLDGEQTTVDKALLPIMVELRRLGVRTQYSCQKDRKTSYFLADRKSLKVLIKKIMWGYENGKYSPESREIIQNFLRGYRCHELSWFRKHKIPGRKSPAIETVFERTLSKGDKRWPRYSVEWLYSNVFGLRAVVRWPWHMNEAILVLLLETAPDLDFIHEISSKQVLPGFHWEENRLSECEYGCKIYRQKGTGLEFLAHNSSYGCPK